MNKNIKKLMEKNSMLAAQYGYDRHYYLEKIMPIEKVWTNFCDNTDKRYSIWMKERKKYGFDSRETWNLDRISLEWLYEHLKLYLKKAEKVVDLNWRDIEINGKSRTQEQWIKYILKKIRTIFKFADEFYDKDQEISDMSKEVWHMWAELVDYMWW